MKYVNEVGVRDSNELIAPQDYLQRYDVNKRQIESLEQENQILEKKAFDAVIRVVIDKGMVYMKCNHKYVKVKQQPTPIVRENRRVYLESGLSAGSWFTGGGTSMSPDIFYGTCQQCQQGINRHDCSIENEVYYFTCDEARVINNVARQYGIKGSIHTATQIRD